MIIEINLVQLFIDSIFQMYSDTNSDRFDLDQKDYYQTIEDNMSPLLKSDLKYFYSETTIGRILLDQPILDHSTVPKYIKSLDILIKMSSDELLDLFLFNTKQYSDYDKNDLNKIFDELQVLHESLDGASHAKKGYIELYTYPKDTLHRLKVALDRYYKTHYMMTEKKIIKILEIEKDRLLKLYPDSNPLLKEISRIDIDGVDIESINTTNNITYFPLSLLTITINNNLDHLTNTFHYTYLDKFDPVKMLQTSSEFIKVISDETRMKIIKLLASKRYYSTQIAKELGLNRGTVSYHMEKLKKVDVIKFTLEKNKIYYSLHKEHFEDMFESFIKGLDHLKL